MRTRRTCASDPPGCVRGQRAERRGGGGEPTARAGGHRPDDACQVRAGMASGVQRHELHALGHHHDRATASRRRHAQGRSEQGRRRNRPAPDALIQEFRGGITTACVVPAATLAGMGAGPHSPSGLDSVPSESPVVVAVEQLGHEVAEAVGGGRSRHGDSLPEPPVRARALGSADPRVARLAPERQSPLRGSAFRSGRYRTRTCDLFRVQARSLRPYGSTASAWAQGRR